MRTLFLLLLLANLAFFAWARYLTPPDPYSDSRPRERQVAPQRLVLLPARAPSAPSAPPPPPAAAPPRPAAATSPGACIEWGSFTLADAERAEKALEPLALGARLARHRVEESANWWVFIAPQSGRQGAQKKAAELKALGVDDYFVVLEDGRFQWAISLGVYRLPDAAQERLDALRAHGVHSAQIGQREAQVQKVWLQVRDADPQIRARLRDVAKDAGGTELRACST